ncbi:MAG: sugar transferase [Paludibacteraceae bacterium]|nr:sugar transferase [Paludibacteraceae bacterium]
MTVCLLFFLLVAWWLMPLIVVVMKITMPGPVLFRQQRTGLGGRPFTCYKFRSMHQNVEADSRQATQGDNRLTRFGAYMRRHDLDELPQFWNVLRGDMSVVGPRPHMLVHTETYSQQIPQYARRHLVRPGITGYAQITGSRGETSALWQMEERVSKDLYYIQHWSLWLDLQIIIGSALSLFVKKYRMNAY